MSFANSSSDFLRFRQNPRCPGPSGATGPGGATGPTGPGGNQGPPGLSTGLEYYFYTEQTGSTYPNQPMRNNVGPTGFSMQLVPGAGPATPPGNGYYNFIGETYSGYFSFIDATGFTGSNNGLLASFNLPLTGFNTIPAGSWNFSNQIYTYRTNSWPTNQTGSTIGMVPSLTYYTYGPSGTTGPTGTVISSQSKSIDIGYTDIPYNYSLYLPNSIPIQFPSKDYINVRFSLTGTFASNQFAEFWSEGGSVSQVITSFAPQSGPTGAVGPTGPGVIGEMGQVAFYGAGGVATGSNALTWNTASNRLTAQNLTVNARYDSPNGSIALGPFGLVAGDNLTCSGGTKQTLGNVTCESLTSNGNLIVNSSGFATFSGAVNLNGNVSNTSGPINFINGGGILVNQTATVGALTSVGNISAANLGGTYNNFLIGNIRIQTGRSLNNASDNPITFPVAFSAAPTVSVTLFRLTNPYTPPPFYTYGITTTQFNIRFFEGAGGLFGSGSIDWIAIGNA